MRVRELRVFPDGRVARAEELAADDAAVLREENARLVAENRQLSRQLDLMRQAVETAIYELDTHALAHALARQAAQMTNSEHATVGVLEYGAILVQAHTGQAHAVQARTPSDNAYIYPIDLRTGPGTGLAPKVVATGRTMTCHNPLTEPALGAEFAQRYGVRNAVCVPVQNHQSTVLAFIEVMNRRGGGVFTRQDVYALESLALAASVGLERARLLDRLSEWSRSLEMLLGFSAAVNQHLEPTQLIRHLVENAALFLKADGGMAGLSVPQDEADALMVCEGLWNRSAWHDWHRQWHSQQGLAGYVMENEFPYLSNDYASDPLADSELIDRFGVRQGLCVPIKDQSEVVIGFFELHRSTTETPFTWQDAAFLESLANVTAVSIRNAQLLMTLEARGAEIRALSANHVHRLEEERQHISRELHDEAGQVLIGIKLALQVAARQATGEQSELRRDLDELRDQVNLATIRLKDLARWLRPPTLDQLGLEVALEQLVTDLRARAEVDVATLIDRIQPRLPQSWEIALYRIAQEALTNVLRHAETERAELTLRADGQRICLVVRDCGRGFDAAVEGGGLGLLGMKERAGMLGGVLRVSSVPGAGTEVRMEVIRPCDTNMM